MTVRVRLQRLGRRNKPFYRVVVADSRAPRDGKFIELVSRVPLSRLVCFAALSLSNRLPKPCMAGRTCRVVGSAPDH